jgi:hypothetical protein
VCAACLKNSVRIFVEKIYKMGCLEGSGVPVLCIGRTVPKGQFYLNILIYSRTSIIRASINRATLLRAVLEEDGDLREFYKKWTIKHAMFSCSDCWNDIPNVTLRKY